MSRTTNCIRMLNILNSRKIVTRKELAFLLDTKERNISEYREELVNAGYKIDLIAGMYGGYQLDKTSLIPSLKLNDKEKEALFEASNKLVKDSSFVHGEALASAIGKVLSNTINYYEIESKFVFERFPLLMNKEELKERYEILDLAIKESYTVSITYNGINNKIRDYLLYPYLLYNSNQGWYVNAFVQNTNSISRKPLNFKLNRIKEIKLTKDKFIKDPFYDTSKILDSNGMNFGDTYRVKVILTPPHNVFVQERKFGENQVVTILDDNHTMLECDMKLKENVISFLLFFGSCATLIEPKEIIDELKLTTRKMVNRVMNKKTIFFDFNGTILDDVDLCLNLLNDLLTENKLKTLTKDEYKHIFCFPVKSYYEKAGLDFNKVSFEELSKDFIKKYQKPSLKCNLQENVVETIKDLIEKGYNVVLLTASKTSNVIEQLKHFNIYELFSDVLGLSDIYATSKVEVGKNYIKNYNIDPKDAIMIGDTDHDKEVASQMGIDCILYSNGHQARDVLERVSDKVIDDFCEVYKYI